MVDDIPEISTISPPESPCGIVDTPVTSPSNIENFKLSTIVLVVPIDTIGLPIIWSTLAVIVGLLKFILSLTLYPVPELTILIDVIVDENSFYLKNQMQIEDIPSNFTVAAIIRNGQVKIPNTMTEIKFNDELLIFAKPEDALEAENLFVAR